MYTEIKKCRICKSSSLKNILNLGEQCLTGVFPKNPDEEVTKGPLDLVACMKCGLLQLKQSFSLDEMYGDNYGYRSSLNQTMVTHLEKKISSLQSLCPLSTGDIVVDIGSNDATTLKLYNTEGVKKIGIDPTGNKFSKYYTDGIELITDFFPSELFYKLMNSNKAKIITSIAMFYDLEDPKFFVNKIAESLHEDGIWHFEQSYMPLMLEMNSYDTICHEHLEFYSFTVIKNLLDKCGLKIIDVEINDINGGSFAVTACHKNSVMYEINNAVINLLLNQEKELGIGTMKPYIDFSKRVSAHKDNLLGLLTALKKEGKKIFGYGASTKGNVLLQYCGITKDEIPYIAEVNDDKFGCFTPGSNIPIIPEVEARKMNPDYYFVLPWHFKHNILEKEKEFSASGGKFIFPLPQIEII